MSMPNDEVTKVIHNLNSLTNGSWNETPSSQNYGQAVSLALSFIDPQTGLPSYYNMLPANMSATLAEAFGQGFNTGTAL